MKRIFLASLVLLGGFASQVRAADTVYYYYNDAQGSPVAVTDAQGNVVERTQYAPYGQVLNRPEHDGPGYTKHEEDAATGLTNMQQRYDDKVIGRMLSMDPMDVETIRGANFNRYAYAADNPYRFIDPDGRQDCTSKDCKDTEKKPQPVDTRSMAFHDPGVGAFLQGASAWGSAGGQGGTGISYDGSVIYKAGVPAASADVSDMLRCTASCTGNVVRVTSTSDSHGPSDPHTRGLAADVTTSNPQKLMRCAANCGARYQQNEYLHPSRNATGGHVHLQLVPGRHGATGPYHEVPVWLRDPNQNQNSGN